MPNQLGFWDEQPSAASPSSRPKTTVPDRYDGDLLVFMLMVMTYKEPTFDSARFKLNLKERDAQFLHSLADYWTAKQTLTDRQRHSAARVLRSYRRQLLDALGDLPSAHIDAALSVSQPTQEEGVHLVLVPSEKGNGAEIEIRFPYQEALVQACRDLPNRRYDTATRRWYIPEANYRDALRAFPGAEIDPALRDRVGLTRRGNVDLPKPIDVMASGRIDVSGSHIVITFPFNELVVAECHRIPDAKYNKEKNRWEAPKSELETALRVFPNFERSDKIRLAQAEAEAEAHAREIRRKEQLEDSERRIAKLMAATHDLTDPLPNRLDRTLLQHQRKYTPILIRDRRIILAWDMGTGKTYGALSPARAFVDDCEIIVICPATLQDEWREAAREFGLPPISVFSWHMNKIPTPPNHPYIVIADEAHMAQNPNSGRGKAFNALCGGTFCRAVWMLSGTPMKNGKPSNLYPLLKAAHHPIARSKSYYDRHFSAAKPTRYSKWDTNGADNLDELREALAQVMIRLRKEDCLDLPPKVRVLRKAETTEAQEKAYEAKLEQLWQEYQRRIATGEIVGGNDAMVMLGHARHAASIAKVETAMDLASELLDNDRPVVLFVSYLETARLLAEEIESRFKCPVGVLSGETPMKARHPMIKDFQNGSGARAMVCTHGAGGVGVTLTAADTNILVDRPWTPGDTRQAEDRIHRQGQRNYCTIYWVQAFDTDEEIDEALLDKQNAIDTVMGESASLSLDGIAEPSQSAGEIAMQALRKVMARRGHKL